MKFRDNNPWEFAIALFAYAILFAFYPQSLLNDNKKTIAMLLFMALLIVIVYQRLQIGGIGCSGDAIRL